MIETALPDLAAWTERLRRLDIPVWSHTAEAVALLAQREEEQGDVDARMISDLVANDALMTLKVLAHVATHRPASLVTDAVTVTAAVMVMGMSAFFRTFRDMPTVEAHLAGHPDALAGLKEVERRARRAARFALSFAVHRMDDDAPLVHEATLLHDVAEMLLWCHAPALAGEIARRQALDPALRSADAQREVLNIELRALEQSLMKAWRLPELLMRITDDRDGFRQTQSTMVRLAVQLARHTRDGWDNAALPDDLEEIAQLLNLSKDAAWRLVQDIDD
jgi:HD-like signal output (HDOD) protein